ELWLSRALGRPASLAPSGPTKPAAARGLAKDPKESGAGMSWVDGGVPVTVRWRNGAVIEVRAGDAVPGDPHARAFALRPPPSSFKTALVSLVAYPGGEIFLDNVRVGRDATGPLRLKPGKHEVRVKNRFLGDVHEPLEISDRQTGNVVVGW